MADDRQSDDLDRRIANARAAEQVRSGDVRPAKGYSQGARVLTELIGAPLGGGILGWALDHWLHTSPWFLLIFIAVAIVVAFRNIFRISKERAE